MPVVVVSGVIVGGQKIYAEVAFEVTPDGVDMVGVVLGIVVFYEES